MLLFKTAEKNIKIGDKIFLRNGAVLGKCIKKSVLNDVFNHIYFLLL